MERTLLRDRWTDTESQRKGRRAERQRGTGFRDNMDTVD